MEETFHNLAIGFTHDVGRTLQCCLNKDKELIFSFGILKSVREPLLYY